MKMAEMLTHQSAIYHAKVVTVMPSFKGGVSMGKAENAFSSSMVAVVEMQITSKRRRPVNNAVLVGYLETCTLLMTNTTCVL